VFEYKPVCGCVRRAAIPAAERCARTRRIRGDQLRPLRLL